MTIGIWQQEGIAAVLHECVPQARVVRPYQWEFTLVNGKPFSVTARVENEWMIFETYDTDVKSHDGWQLLQLNTRLGSTTRFVIGSRSPKATLRSEVLLHEGLDLFERLRTMTDNLTTGMGLLHETNHRGKDQEPSSRTPISPDDAASIRKLCEESGWIGQQRNGGDVVVPLEVDQGIHQVLVERDWRGGLHLSTTCEPVSVNCQSGDGERDSRGGQPKELGTRAVAQFLLRVTSKLRMVRAEMISEDESVNEEIRPPFKLRFTCLLTDRVHATELNEAFANLSMACELAANEVVALGDIGLAQRYLQIQNDVHNKG